MLAGSAVVAVATAAVVAGLAATLPDPTALREENPTHSRYMRLQARERGVADDAYTVACFTTRVADRGVVVAAIGREYGD